MNGKSIIELAQEAKVPQNKQMNSADLADLITLIEQGRACDALITAFKTGFVTGFATGCGQRQKQE